MGGDKEGEVKDDFIFFSLWYEVVVGVNNWIKECKGGVGFGGRRKIGVLFGFVEFELYVLWKGERLGDSWKYS